MRISDWSSDVCSSDLRRGVDAHDHDRLIADFVDAVVAGLRDLVEARGDLPDFAPEFLELELRESGIDVTTDADAMRHRAPAWRPVAVAAGLRRTPCVDGETHDTSCGCLPCVGSATARRRTEERGVGKGGGSTCR